MDMWNLTGLRGGGSNYGDGVITSHINIPGTACHHVQQHTSLLGCRQEVMPQYSTFWIAWFTCGEKCQLSGFVIACTKLETRAQKPGVDIHCVDTNFTSPRGEGGALSLGFSKGIFLLPPPPCKLVVF